MARRQNVEKAAKRAARRPASAPVARCELVDAPKRRSSRIEGKPARNYSESTLEAVERPERRSRLLDRHSARPAPSPPAHNGAPEAQLLCASSQRAGSNAAHLLSLQGRALGGACSAPS